MQFGYYGKAVHRGDFVKFNLPQTFINVWDDWLQQVLHEGEIRHEDDWSAIYNNCPTYRFGMSSGIAGETPWIGIMRAATDKVGRRFPFCIALSLPPDVSPIAHAMALEPIYARIQKLITEVVQPDYDFDTLQNTMADISSSLNPALEKLSHSVTNNFIPSDPTSNLSIRTNSSSVLHHPAHVSSLLDSLLKQTWFSYSVWQAASSTDKTQTSLISCGLPLTASALALFDGSWKSAKTGHLQLSDNQSDLATLSLLTDDSTDSFEAREVQSELLIENKDTVIDADSTQPGPETALSELELTLESDDTPLEFQPTEIIAPPDSEPGNETPPAEPAKDTIPPDDIVDPVVEPLELDEEFADDNPWDKN